MFDITEKTWDRSKVLNGLRWLNEKYIEEGLDHANLPVLTRKYPSKH